MALTAVETGLQGIFDRWAYQMAAAELVCVGGTDVWSRVDAMGDETAENRLKGSHATAVDTSFETMPYNEFSSMVTFLADLSTYAVTDLGLASFNAYLTAKRWRVDSRVADLWYGRFASRLSAANVHGPADGGAAAPGISFGDVVRGSTFTAGTDLDTDLVSASPVLARVTAIGASDWTLSVVCTCADATSKTIAQVVEGTGDGGAIGDTYVVGRQAISAGAASGQKVVSVAATAQFRVGETVLLTQWSGSPPSETWLEQEIGTIASIVTDTSITLEDNLLHTYTTAGYVYPLFVGVSSATDSGGTAGDRAYFFPGADRRLKL